MRALLWPEEDGDTLGAELAGLADSTFVAEKEGHLIGFAETAVRNYAEGAEGPAAYLEGIWVDPPYRRQGVARALLEAAERWARAAGFADFGSDALLDNQLSHHWHAAVGFREVERLIVYHKRLR